MSIFRHKSSPLPPALSSEGTLNSCKKSDLFECIQEATIRSDYYVVEEPVAPNTYGFIVIDGGALIHSIPGKAIQGKTFDDYFDKIFMPRIRYDLKRSGRVDIVWDQYRELAIKGGTREKRGTGTQN